MFDKLPELKERVVDGLIELVNSDGVVDSFRKYRKKHDSFNVSEFIKENKKCREKILLFFKELKYDANGKDLGYGNEKNLRDYLKAYYETEMEKQNRHVEKFISKNQRRIKTLNHNKEDDIYIYDLLLDVLLTFLLYPETIKKLNI